MATYTKIIRINDCQDLNILKRKIPNIEHYKFILDLNQELVSLLPKDLSTYINGNRLKRTALNVFAQISLRGVETHQHFRLDSCESEYIMQSLTKKSDPTLQILKEHLSQEIFTGVSTLICTKTLITPPSSQFTIKLCLSC